MEINWQLPGQVPKSFFVLIRAMVLEVLAPAELVKPNNLDFQLYMTDEESLFQQIKRYCPQERVQQRMYDLTDHFRHEYPVPWRKHVKLSTAWYGREFSNTLCGHLFTCVQRCDLAGIDTTLAKLNMKVISRLVQDPVNDVFQFAIGRCARANDESEDYVDIEWTGSPDPIADQMALVQEMAWKRKKQILASVPTVRNETVLFLISRGLPPNRFYTNGETPNLTTWFMKTPEHVIQQDVLLTYHAMLMERLGPILHVTVLCDLVTLYLSTPEYIPSSLSSSS